jgi:hypothetical protein
LRCERTFAPTLRCALPFLRLERFVRVVTGRTAASVGTGFFFADDLADMPDSELVERPGGLLQPGTAEVLDFETVLNKVRRLVCSVRLSDKRRQALESHCHDTNIKFRVPRLDRLGRWNTVHDMLDDMLHLQRPLRLLTLDDPRLILFWPTTHEWEMVGRFKTILLQYKEATLIMEREKDQSVIWAFPVLDKLMTSIEEFQDTGRWGDAAIKQALHLAWEKLSSYYRVMSQEVYYVCLFLDPQVKSTYVEKHWEEDWIRHGEERLQAAWSRYKNLQVDAPATQYSPPDQARHSPALTAPSGRRVPPNPFQLDIETQGDVPQLDELDEYRKMSFLNPQVWATRYESNSLLWWADTGQHMFPRLARMAKDFFSAQGMTVVLLLSCSYYYS